MTDPDTETALETADESAYESALALVGMAGRFPGAASPAELWRNLLAGAEGLRAITEEELAAAGLDPRVTSDPNYVRVGAPVAGLDQFDAGVFGFSPREAETMEPQHRLFLECSWEALEGAGYCPVDTGGSVGVFAGCAFPDYMIDNVGHMATEPGSGLLFAVGNERDSLTSLVSYKLGLTGPSMTVQTFCSTSLVAVHLACQSLLTYECDIALAGGTFLPLPQPVGYRYEEGSITSPDGKVRSFDASANGTVMGSGVGVVALKRMTDALAEGDVIHAVILGSAVNNDGPNRVGYTAPGVDGQAGVIANALSVAGVKPETIGYVECHATGTQLGDSIELAAMARVFDTPPETPCVLSSVKPRIGHLDRAAGVTGLMRAAMALEHELLPGTPGYESPNPTLAAAADRFTVLTENKPWPAGPEPRRAGVSSFGLGGTNAHVVLEQAPPRPRRAEPCGPQLLTFSAADPGALAALTERLRSHLADNPDADLADVAYTLQLSRGHFALRRAVAVRDTADAVAALADQSRWIDGLTERRDPVLRLSESPDATEVFRTGLAAATDTLLAGSAAGSTTAIRSLAAGLSRLGVQIAATADAEELVVGAHPDPELAVLTTLARAWLAGASVDWAELHGGTGRRVELPTYPFQRSRYWVEARPAQPAALPPVTRYSDVADWTYLPTWRQSPALVADLDEQLREAGPWLVLTDDPVGSALADRLITAGAELVLARAGTGFASAESGDYTVRPDSIEDLTELLGCLLVAPRTIVHGFSLGSPAGPDFDAGAGAEPGAHSPAAHFETEQDRGLRSAIALAAALAEDPDPMPAELVLLTSRAASVTGSDLRHPEHAGFAALAPSLAQENPQLGCRSVDLQSVADLEQALAAIVGVHQGPVAVRGGELWVRSYQPQPLAAPDPDRPLFRAEDTVLITGGLGNVGLVLARHLAASYGCRLVLTARTPLPPRAEWQRHLAGDDRVARHLRNILELEASGASVLALAADVADEEQMRAVVRAAVETFGGIDVVVHGAGVQNPEAFGLVHQTERDVCDSHLRSKVHGLFVLQSVLGELAPDRRITLSSISAVLGGLALGPYAAANAALDAYARLARLSGAGRWITVDWDTWGIDADRAAAGGQTARDYEMTAAEGIEVFERALAAAGQLAQTVISTGPLSARLEQWVTGVRQADQADQVERERHPRPALSTPYAEPETGLEEMLASIWAETLALETVGANDNFFDLGGHSLLAITLITRLRASAAPTLPVTALVEHPTVRQLRMLIEQG